jgi:hypothetical protein
VRQRRRGPGGPGRPGQRRGPGSGARPRRDQQQQQQQQQQQVEQPRTDEQGDSAEGREQPVITPQVEETPKPIAEAPDTTTPKQQVEDPTKLEQSGDPSQEKPKRSPRKTKDS